MKFGELLRSKRKEHNKNMIDITDEVKNLSQPYLSQIERGERNPPSKEMIEEISKAIAPGNAMLTANLLKAAGYYSDEDVQRILDEEFVKPVKMLNEAFKNNSIQIQKSNGRPRPINAPSFDLEWLLSQDKYHLLYGKYDITGDVELIPSMPNVLSDEDVHIIRDMIHAYISNRYEKIDKD